MKPLILLLAHIALAPAAGSALAQTDSDGAPANAATAGLVARPISYDQQYEEARTLANSGQEKEAIQAYSDLLILSPGNADVLLGRGQVYARMNRWPEAEADLLAVTAASPNYADAWSALGNMYMWSDRPMLAIEAFGRWVDLRPTDPAPHIARGRAYRAAGDYAAARADFEAAATAGADAKQIESYLLSPKPQVNNPEAVIPAGFLWSASLGASWTTFSPDRQDWSDYSLSVRRHFEHGSLAFELLDTRRFGVSDQAWALDGYLDLWSRAYANLRYQQGPQASLFPDSAYYGELFQGVGQGWELSGSYGRLEFSSSNVNMYGVGVGKYVGNYYIRLRHSYIPGNGSVSNSNRLLARYYYAGDGDNYVEANVSAGTSNSDDKSGVNVQTKSSAVGVAYVKYPTPRWGFKIGADLGRESDSFTSRSVSGSLYLRW